MTDKDRIKRLEDVVETLIGWLYTELGSHNAISLIKELQKDGPQKHEEGQR